MAVATYTKSGSKASAPAKLDKAVFDVEIKNHELVKQAYTAYLANGRENLSKTLRRGEVRGGGKKPWKQKGTGRARFGSIRVPIWRGGGITFGPLGEENYSKKLTKAAKQTAIRQALTMNKDNVKVVDSVEAKDGKTAELAKLLKKVEAKGNVLVAVETKDETVVRASNNLENVKLVNASYLNVYDIMNADTIVISKKGLDLVHEWLGVKKEAK